MYHAEQFILPAKAATARNEEDRQQSVTFTIPIFEPLPPQYYIRAISERWLGSETVVPISFRNLILPQLHPPHTSLLDLQPLPLEALHDKRLQSLYRFTHFNPVQTQIFHTLYHTDHNVLLGKGVGGSIGAGKSVCPLVL